MNDLYLDPLTHDLDVSNLGLAIVQGADAVRQNILIKLRFWRGEWFLDTEAGTPYLEDILGKSISLAGALAAIRASILEVADVNALTSFNYSFNRQTRTMDYNFTASTPFGLVEVRT
jgi:hypothetical protein